MTALELIRTYSPVGDVLTAVASIIILVIVKTSLYYANDLAFSYLKRSVHFIMVGSVANIFFGYVCTYHPTWVVTIFLLRDIYHVALLVSLAVFTVYIRQLLKTSGSVTSYGGILTNIVFLVGIIMDVLSPFTRFGFYYEDGVWYDATYLKPFTLVYIYALSYFVVVFIMYSQRMIRPVRQSLMVTEALAVIILLYQSEIDSNAYASFTFLLPIIVVFILLHSKPFDLTTGAINGTSFNLYIKHINNKKASVDYMVLKLDTKVIKEIPAEVGKIINSFWHKYFKEAVLFSLEPGTFALAIKRCKKNGDTEAKIEDLINNVFPKYYDKYRIQYRIVALYDINFIEDLGELEDYIAYLFDKEHTNSSYFANAKDIEELRKIGRTKECLRDIAAKQNLDDERVLVYCQPVVNMKTGKYDTAEALMRLTVDGKLTFPDVFIPLAERAGFIHTLSKIILNKVCKQAKELMKEGYEFSRISVNFSLLEMGEPDFCAEVVEIIAKHDIPFDMIAFELTESQNENDYKLVLDQIETLKMFGIKVYLDDFGTGYSNFDRILGLGVDVIKFDRSLLVVTDTNQTLSYSLRHFSQAFKELDYKILFEGVETKEHEDLCRECGADYLQGYKFSKPIPIEKLREFFEKAQG